MDENTNSYFNKVMDEIILMSEHDPELKASLKFLDEFAFKNNMTIYEALAYTLNKESITHNNIWFLGKEFN